MVILDYSRVILSYFGLFFNNDFKVKIYQITTESISINGGASKAIDFDQIPNTDYIIGCSIVNVTNGSHLYQFSASIVARNRVLIRNYYSGTLEDVFIFNIYTCRSNYISS